MITRVGTVGVWVSDQKAALDFYVGKLGFEKIADTGAEDEYRWIEVVPHYAETGIALMKPYAGITHAFGKDPQDLIGTSTFVFDTDDISATYRDLQEKGVVFTEKPTMQAWGRLQARFVDPDGNSFILMERAGKRN